MIMDQVIDSISRGESGGGSLCLQKLMGCVMGSLVGFRFYQN